MGTGVCGVKELCHKHGGNIKILVENEFFGIFISRNMLPKRIFY